MGRQKGTHPDAITAQEFGSGYSGIVGHFQIDSPLHGGPITE